LSEAHESLSFLDLRDNDIKDFSDLEPLATLPCLTILKLNGNPVSKLPFYKPRVIAMLSSLGELDDEDVTEEEKREASIWWKEEEARLAAIAAEAEE